MIKVETLFVSLWKQSTRLQNSLQKMCCLLTNLDCLVVKLFLAVSVLSCLRIDVRSFSGLMWVRRIWVWFLNLMKEMNKQDKQHTYKCPIYLDVLVCTPLALTSKKSSTARWCQNAVIVRDSTSHRLSIFCLLNIKGIVDYIFTIFPQTHRQTDKRA